MDLKIKDVAELLNVSETTIRRWLTDGKIPAYKINHQYRFNRLEIEDWVMSQRLKSPQGISPYTSHYLEDQEEAQAPLPPAGRKQFSLYRALHKGGVLQDVPGKSKEEIIRAAVKKIAPDLGLDIEVLTELLLDRERLQPTALNHGIGIPHTRECLLKAGQNVVTVVYPKHPIAYGALDGEPVHTLFFLFASDDKKHLHLLAKIAHMSSRSSIVDFLRSKPTKDQLLERVKEWEVDLAER